MCLASYILRYFLFSPSLFRYFHLRVPSSVQQLFSPSTQQVRTGTWYYCCSMYVFFLLVSFVSCLISEFLSFICLVFFRRSDFSRRVFCCDLVPGKLTLDLLTLIISRLLWFFLSVCDHVICASQVNNREGHWGYC